MKCIVLPRQARDKHRENSKKEWRFLRRALYSENDDGLSYHNYYSTLLVRQQHPDWTNATKIAEEAERQYNAGSQLFFTETLRTAKKLRPKGKFGFYEYPMAASPELTWLWSEVGVMAGSQCAHPVFRCLSCLSALRFLRAQRVVLPFLPAASHCADIIFAIAHYCIIVLWQVRSHRSLDCCLS